MNFKAPRGTHDIFGINVKGIFELEKKAREIFAKHGFEEIRTPIFEDAALFIRSIGDTSDIVEKEMYVFEDRKGRKLALRPEGTASLVRAYIEHRMDLEFPTGRFFYCGEMFRYERPQAGRYRQFHQMGVEFIGNSSPAADAEVIIVAADILSSIGIKDINIHINSLGCDKCRPLFRKALIEYFSSVEDLCGDCERRLEKNPLRLLDCKKDAHKFDDVPDMQNFLCTDCKENFNLVQSLLKASKYNFIVDSKLVRGLDYYNRTVFELKSDAVGSQDTLAGGGRYDNLIKELGGQNMPAVGFAFGSERVMMAAEKAGFLENLPKSDTIFIAIADQELFQEAFVFATKISKSGFMGDHNISVIGPFNGKSLTSQLKFADKINADKTIVFAKTEFDKGKVLLKDMKAKTQEETDYSKII